MHTWGPIQTILTRGRGTVLHIIFKNEVAIGPVTGRTLYSYRSGSHVPFYIYSRACHFYCFSVLSHYFVVPFIQFAGRILAFHVQFCKDTIMIT